MRERLPALDALRGVAVMLVVLHHALLPYADLSYGPLWVARADPSAQSRLLSNVLWWLITFIMPLYFVLAGFCAARLSAALGPPRFLRHRVRRIFVPYLLGAVVLLPLTFYVFAAGWWLAGECTWNEIRRVRFAPNIQSELFGPVHLWFLAYLFVYCVIFWLADVWLLRARRQHATRTAAGSLFSRLLASPWRALWCALPTALVICTDPGVVTTFHNSFVPDPSKFLLYAVYFATGVCFYHFAPTMTALGNRLYLVLSVVLFAAIEPQLRSSFAGELSAITHLLFAAGLAVTAWLSIFGLLGCFQGRNSLSTSPRANGGTTGGPNPTHLTFIADASYWTYLVHLPLVAALQIMLATVPAPAVLKCTVVAAVALAACLWSYERWVRYTFIGAALNGPRHRPDATAWAASSVAPSSTAWMASAE